MKFRIPWFLILAIAFSVILFVPNFLNFNTFSNYQSNFVQSENQPLENLKNIKKDGNNQSELKTTSLSDVRSVIGAQWLIDKGITGKGVKVGIIDSGVTNSSSFSSRFIAASSFVTIDNGYSKDELSLTDDYNHGTRVAEYALGESIGIAPDALLTVKSRLRFK